MSTIEKIIEIVENVYLEVLLRPADLDGRNHWVGRMKDSKYPNTKEELVEIFKMSDEYKNRPLTTLPYLDIVHENIVNQLDNIEDILNKITSGPEPMPKLPMLKIVSPSKNQMIVGNKVSVTVKSMYLVEGDHFHVFLDGDSVGMYYSDKFSIKATKYGSHSLQVVIADKNHVKYTHKGSTASVNFTTEEKIKPEPEPTPKPASMQIKVEYDQNAIYWPTNPNNKKTAPMAIVYIKSNTKGNNITAFDFNFDTNASAGADKNLDLSNRIDFDSKNFVWNEYPLYPLVVSTNLEGNGAVNGFTSTKSSYYTPSTEWQPVLRVLYDSIPQLTHVTLTSDMGGNNYDVEIEKPPMPEPEPKPKSTYMEVMVQYDTKATYWPTNPNNKSSAPMAVVYIKSNTQGNNITAFDFNFSTNASTGADKNLDLSNRIDFDSKNFVWNEYPLYPLVVSTNLEGNGAVNGFTSTSSSYFTASTEWQPVLRVLYDSLPKLTHVTLTSDMGGKNYDVKIVGNLNRKLNRKLRGQGQLFGDINQNDEVDIGDAQYISAALAGLKGYTLPPVPVGDINSNKSIDIGDAQYISAALAGLEGYDIPKYYVEPEPKSPYLVTFDQKGANTLYKTAKGVGLTSIKLYFKDALTHDSSLNTHLNGWAIIPNQKQRSVFMYAAVGVTAALYSKDYSLLYEQLKSNTLIGISDVANQKAQDITIDCGIEGILPPEPEPKPKPKPEPEPEPLPGGPCEKPQKAKVGDNPFDTSGSTSKLDIPKNIKTFQFGDQNIYNIIYMKFMTNVSDVYEFSTCNQASFDTRLAVLTTCGLSSSVIAANDDIDGCTGFTSMITTNLVKNKIYYICIGSFSGATGTGTGTLTISSSKSEPVPGEPGPEPVPGEIGAPCTTTSDLGLPQKIGVPGQTDCKGQCVQLEVYDNWLGDGYCDDGTWGVYFNCNYYNNDNGDCAPTECNCKDGNIKLKSEGVMYDDGIDIYSAVEYSWKSSCPSNQFYTLTIYCNRCIDGGPLKQPFKNIPNESKTGFIIYGFDKNSEVCAILEASSCDNVVSNETCTTSGGSRLVKGKNGVKIGNKNSLIKKKPMLTKKPMFAKKPMLTKKPMLAKKHMLAKKPILTKNNK